MRVTQHHISTRRRFRSLYAGGALVLALALGGCSAVNMTGFSFPVFGLTKKSAAESDALATASIPGEQGVAGTQQQRLTSQ